LNHQNFKESPWTDTAVDHDDGPRLPVRISAFSVCIDRIDRVAGDAQAGVLVVYRRKVKGKRGARKRGPRFLLGGLQRKGNPRDREAEELVLSSSEEIGGSQLACYGFCKAR
jgi:hypothetical protein